MKFHIYLLVASTIFLSMDGCATGTSTSGQLHSPSGLQSESTVSKEAKNSGEQEWEKVLEAARKEGKITLYINFPPALRQAIGDAFEKKTGIKTEMVTGRGDEIAAKVLIERRAGLYLADVHLGGTTTSLTQLRPAGALKPILPDLFLPEVLDTRLWYGRQLPFMDSEQLVMQYRFTPDAAMMDVAFDPRKIRKKASHNDTDFRPFD